MEVRTVDPADGPLCAALGAIVTDAYLALPGHVPDPEYDASLADVAVRAGLPSTSVLAVFGTDGGEPLGCVTYVAGLDSPLVEHDDPDAGSFRMLGIAPAAQGRGAGRLLVTACIDRARRDGRARVRMHSTAWMAGAHRLYESMGFVRDPAYDDLALPEIPLLAFRLDL